MWTAGEEATPEAATQADRPAPSCRGPHSRLWDAMECNSKFQPQDVDTHLGMGVNNAPNRMLAPRRRVYGATGRIERHSGNGHLQPVDCLLTRRHESYQRRNNH